MSSTPAVGTVEVGQSIGERTIHVDRATLIRYAGASGDFNVIHWDEQVAKAVGLPDVIAHGMWTMGAAVQLVVDWCGDAGRIISYGTRFSSPVPVPREVGADVQVSGVVKKVEGNEATVELTVKVDGAKVLTRALAVVRLAGE